MSNPWLKKNPFMSMWLSAAHRVAGTVRGQAAGQIKRQSTQAARQVSSDWVKMWTDAATAATSPTVPAKRKKSRK